MKRKPAQSHCPRPHDYKQHSINIDLSRFTNIINIRSIDEELRACKNVLIPNHLKKFIGNNYGGTHSLSTYSLAHLLLDSDIIGVVDVQAMISFEDLVDKLLPYNMIPACVPEFKGITLGGSLQGLAAESTSFKYGFVHDSIIGFEAILGDGSVVWCSANTNSDLFHGLPGTFGSIAFVTRIKMLCIKSAPYVLLQCSLTNNINQCTQTLNYIKDNEKNDIDFLEGFGYSRTRYVTCKGQFLASNDYIKAIMNGPNNFKFLTCLGYGDKWFFNQINDEIKKDKNKNFIYPLKDYLFRHDRGSFWMASYRIPQFIGRWMGSLLDSTNMFKLANMLPWAFPKSVIVLQDFMLPRGRVNIFHDEMQDNLGGLYPLWLLPMHNFRQKQGIFTVPSTNEHLINVGMYGIPRSKGYKFIKNNKDLEALLYHCNGRKVFYSHSFYEKDFFYNELYDGKKYFHLRRKYKVSDAFHEIFDKIITKNGNL